MNLPSPGPLVFDTSPLYHSALCDRLDVLGDLLADHACLTTQVVMDELLALPRGREAIDLIRAAEWLRASPLDSIEALRSFQRWAALVGAGSHNMGEATVLTLCELRSGTAVVDDRKARAIGRHGGIKVTGTLGLLGDACVQARLSWHAAGSMVDALIESGARFPCSGADFTDWYRSQQVVV